jgi:hypothetical protein
MSLSDLAAIGSFISALAVLISLVFLYFQLRRVQAQVIQAERNQQAAISQARTESQISVMVAMASPEVAEAFSKATLGAEDLTATQFSQYTVLSRAMLANGENCFLQRSAGLLADTASETALRQQLLQLPVLVFQRLQLFRVPHIHAAVLRSPFVNVASLMPCLRHSSLAPNPAWCRFKIPMICSSVYRLRFIVRLLQWNGL